MLQSQMLEQSCMPQHRKDNCYCFKLYIYLFLERGEGREKERERNSDVQETNQSVASCTPPCRDWLKTQAYSLTGIQAGDPLVCRPALSPLSDTSKSDNHYFKNMLCRAK